MEFIDRSQEPNALSFKRIMAEDLKTTKRYTLLTLSQQAIGFITVQKDMKERVMEHYSANQDRACICGGSYLDHSMKTIPLYTLRSVTTVKGIYIYTKICIRRDHDAF